MEDFPVYLFTGFLEAGKTRFIQETLEDPRFNGGEPTLLLLCEEGEREYDTTLSCMENVFIEVIEHESDLTPRVLDYLEKKHRAERAMVEYNGMWQLSSFYDSMPEAWAIYQEFLFIDAGTFLNYNANMRGLMVDKLSSCELAVFNRFQTDMDKMEFHKIVRGVNRRTAIVYESREGTVEYDDIEDPLPYDINAPVITLGDEDYALWYRDVSEEPKKYNGKTVECVGMAVVNSRFQAGNFAFGRKVMTCCVEDIQFASFLAQCDSEQMPENKKWYRLRFQMEFKFHKLYGRRGPVLTVLSMEEAEAPKDPVATFY
ncbi:MAG: GTPase [Lachnospiraceae bacterium]|nr:GTPase [Lachnospiraceae bacterium]